MWSCDQSLIKKVRKYWGVNSYVVDVTEEKLVVVGGAAFCPRLSPFKIVLKLKAQKKHIHLHNMKTQKYDFEFTVT